MTGRMTRLLSALLSAILLLSVPGAALAENPDAPAASDPEDAGYAGRLFDTSYVHTVDIIISEEDWADLLKNPLDKTKYSVSVAIDGETLHDVSFATKGNSSLYMVEGEGSSRYSFKINFGKNQKGQTFFGLNKLSLSNGFDDPTYMKDYFCYGLFRKMGVNAPLCSFGWVTVNGEDRGLYLLTEDMSESFLSRVYDGEGVLYKPEAEGYALNTEMVESGNLIPSDLNVKGADLKYTDDALESYSDIFDNNETKAKDDDKTALIAALKGLSEGSGLDSYLDTDEIIRYFAVHNFVLNYDSITGPMLHNYYLYEHAGKLSVLPWDYNGAFGKFLPVLGHPYSEDPTSLVNMGIDSPLLLTTEEAVPIWKWIMENESYRSQYHDVLDQLIREFFESGAYAEEIDSVYELILPYVQTDPTAFFTPEQFTAACGTLKRFLRCRTESVRLQLDGSLATVSELQVAGDRIDASDICLGDL